MKHVITESITLPESAQHTFANNMLTLSQSGVTLSRTIGVPATAITLKGNVLTFHAPKGNKMQFKAIKSQLAHVRNMIRGLKEKYTYKLEACNVHFPMTLKVETNRLAINNFLGEKTPRYARLPTGVDVSVKGTTIIITSSNRELAGQAVSLIEAATKVRKRDRRVFQDGIFLTERPGREL